MKCLMLMGNLGAGKSTLGKMFEAEGWCRVVIDDFRLAVQPPPAPETSDRSLSGGGINYEVEYLARNALLAAVHAAKGNIVYETTTANQVHGKVLKALELKRMEMVRVRLLVSEVESKRRVEARTAKTPNPLEKGAFREHGESFGYIERKLNADWADLVFDTERMGVEEIFFELISRNEMQLY
jgi:hypothetical protein